MQKCNACYELFEDYTALALHISKLKDKAHKNGRRWAANYLSKTRYLNSKKELPVRIPLTEEQKEAKRSTVRETSGELERVQTVCPRCKHTGSASLEVEYTQSGQAWRSANGYFFRYCDICA